jgi:sugar/nucleoside kinase (ribokinase family)
MILRQGAFVNYLNKCGTESISKAIDLAAEYASQTVQYPGTQSSYPKLTQLDSMFKL